MKFARKVHLRGAAHRRLYPARITIVTDNAGYVTCNRCVFELLVQGAINSSDERVTEPMRAHERFRGKD